MPTTFQSSAFDPEKEAAYFQWLDDHPSGFIINRSNGTMMLHNAHCWHSYEKGAVVKNTTRKINNLRNTKICLESLADVER